MNANERWRVITVDLDAQLPELSRESGYDGYYVVFFHSGTALGHCWLANPQLPVSPVQLANVAARACASAAGDRLLAEGFRSALPGLAEPRLQDPLTALQELVRLDLPLHRLGRSNEAERCTLSISVAICTRERPAELRRCLASLRSSQKAPDEIVVIDNAPSSNATRDVVTEFPGVRYHCEPKKGLSAARNAAIAIATGDVVAFADDDVVVHPQWISRILACFEDPAVMVVTGLVLPGELERPAQILFERSLRFFHQGYRRRYFDSSYYPALRSKGLPVWSIGAGANMAIRRTAVALGYRFDTRLGPGVFGGCGEDSEFWYQVLAGGWACVYEPAACVFHYHRREMTALRTLIRQYMQGHVASLILQFRKFGDLGNLRRLFLQLPAEYGVLFLRMLAGGFAIDHRIQLRGIPGCFAGLRAVLARKSAASSAN